ncbi:MAG: sugar phosphate isomerase/epimerase family protein [Planctomycetota bacterium]
MRLSVTTYNIFKDWDLDRLCAELPDAGVEGVEFRIGSGHQHGVELDAPPTARKEARKKLAAAGLCACSIATGCRFHMADADEVARNVAEAKQAIQLAAALGAPRIRVFGNNIVDGVHPDDTAAQVGRALDELGPVGERAGVDVLLEMHGDFNDFRLNKLAVTGANHRAVGTLYNCSPQDVINGSLATVWGEMKGLIRHVHFHDLLADDYPYDELFGLLAADGYSGFLSMEVSMPGDVGELLHAEAERFFELRNAAR